MDDDTDDVYRAKRFYEIDTIKGVATILMVIFHFFYLMYHMNIAKYNIRCGALYASAKIAHILFIFAVGVNLAISYKKFRRKHREDYKNNKYKYYNQFIGKTLRRVLYLLLAGITMSFLSYITFGDLYVKFGIFHFIAAAVFLTMPIVGSKWLSLATSAIIGLLYTITNNSKIIGYSSKACNSAPVFCFVSGIYNTRFSSLDHFSLIPYLGLVSFGIFVGNMIYSRGRRKFLSRDKSKELDNFYERNTLAKNLALFGKYSFEIYFVHFVVFYLMLLGYKKAKLQLFFEHKKNTSSINNEFEQISNVQDPDCLYENGK